MDLHKAIRAIHNSVVTIIGNNQNDIIAKDINENEVIIDWTQVNAWTDPEAYKYKREKEYPNITDYLDGIVKGDTAQVQKYIDDCLAVKAKYPKENN